MKSEVVDNRERWSNFNNCVGRRASDRLSDGTGYGTGSCRPGWLRESLQQQPLDGAQRRNIASSSRWGNFQ